MKAQSYFIFILLTCLSSLLFAKSPVWKVSKGSDYLYIGGTIHLLSKKDFPLPPEFEKAYQDAQILILETDMQAMKSPAFQMKIMQKAVYADGTTIKQHLKPKTYQALKKYLEKSGIPMTLVQSFKPGMISTMLTIFELQKLGMSMEGVDSFYGEKALKDKKQLGQLETVDEQLHFLTTLGEGREDDFINYTLSEIDELPKLMTKLVTAWRTGDNVQLTKLGIMDLKNKFPKIHEMMLLKRNKAWLPKIEKMLKTKKIEIILVGALHLVGENGILNLLKKKGYQIEQF